MLMLDIEKTRKMSVMLQEYEAQLCELIGFCVKINVSYTELKEPMPVQHDIKETIIHISNIVAEVYDIEKSDMLSSNRIPELVAARTTCYKIIRDTLPKISLKTIGKEFNGRDHSTVIHGIQMFDDRMLTEKVFAEKYFRVLEKLTPNNHA